jgi:FixJ family two-component response regulator
MRRDQTSRLIVIVDDDESMQDSLQDLIESAGLEAPSFGSAEEFLESGLHRQTVIDAIPRLFVSVLSDGAP